MSYFLGWEFGDQGVARFDEGQKAFRWFRAPLSIGFKRLDRIIEAIAVLALRYPSVKFTWTHIGSGASSSNIAEVAEKCFAGAVNLRYGFAGNLSNKQVIEFYEENFVDCFLNLSESEGLPVSMMEAMSFGIPRRCSRCRRYRRNCNAGFWDPP
jgi:glycosyltransferase involved in cell wall biosynthesis